MKELLRNEKIISAWKYIKPWLTIVVVVVVLRYTGILSGISFLTNSALLKTGLMNINPENNLAAKEFDYNFQLKDLEGKKIDAKTLKGKVIFINLWATWCGPCRVEMPSIQELYNKVDHDKIIFVMLSLDTDENHYKIMKYVKANEFSFPVFQPTGFLPEQLQVTSIPTTFVIGKDGKIEMKKSGTANYDTEKFQNFLKDLTAK